MTIHPVSSFTERGKPAHSETPECMKPVWLAFVYSFP